MFTGIIEETGLIKSIIRTVDGHRLEIRPKNAFNGTNIGDSFSINGVCLTLVGGKKDSLLFDVVQKSFQGTSFLHSKPNDTVNMERALAWKGRLDGHFVLGHVDRVAKVVSMEKGRDPRLEISIPKEDMIYVVRKGSIAIDGISLTIGEIYEDRVRVYLIPHTMENTGLRHKKAGSRVNVEYDILGKYALKRTTYRGGDNRRITKESLLSSGFI